MTERLLYAELQAKNLDLASALDKIYEESLRVWDEQYLIKFTTHGKAHIVQVERNLDSLTRPLQASTNPLRAEEIFILLAGACLHDIGMQLADDPDARAKHAQYSYELILYSHTTVNPKERRVTLMIDDNNARASIANVARAHWTDYALKLPQSDYILGNTVGRLRLLGVLLAVADLLDISPVRARFFRSVHRLHDLNPLSELHQTVHALVKGFQIKPPFEANPGDLQFQLEWRDNGEAVRTMSDWVLRWFNSQWRQLNAELRIQSGGAVRWHSPWVRVRFGAPEGPCPTLSDEAMNILRAEVAEQLRIDRENLIQKFKDAIDKGLSALFSFPRDSDFDGKMLGDWCEAHARIQKKCRVARLDIGPADTADLSSLVAELLEQWGQHIQVSNDKFALEELERLATSDRDHSLVMIVAADKDSLALIAPLLRASLKTPGDDGTPTARVCLVLTSKEVVVPDVGVVTTSLSGTGFAEDDVRSHLEMRWGYSVENAKEVVGRIKSLGLLDEPGSVYAYIEMHCGTNASEV